MSGTADVHASENGCGAGAMRDPEPRLAAKCCCIDVWVGAYTIVALAVNENFVCLGGAVSSARLEGLVGRRLGKAPRILDQQQGYQVWVCTIVSPAVNENSVCVEGTVSATVSRVRLEASLEVASL